MFEFGQMPGLAVVALLPAAVTTYLALKIVYTLFFHPLRAYPGPLLWRISSLPWDIAIVRGTLPRDKARFHERYGPVVRIRPDELSYTSAQAWKDIFAHTPGKPEFTKDGTFGTPPPNGLPNILLAEKGPHDRYRRILSHAFSEKGLREQTSRIHGMVDLFIERLASLAKAEETVDMVEWFNMVTFDLIGDLAFGESFGSLELGKLHSWAKALPGSVRYTLVSAVYKNRGLNWLIPYVVSEKLIANRVTNYRLTMEKMDRRMAHTEERGDFWDKVIAKSAKYESTGEGMSQGEMLNNALILNLAGSETSATTLSGAIYLLGKNPEKLKKLVKEIRAAYRKSEDINTLSIAHLSYTSAVVDETMRLYPAVPNQVPRITPPGGATVEGKWLPKNIIIGVSALASTKLGWARPNDFIPERFTANPDPEFVNDPRGASQPFSMGTRNCIGRNLAFVELRLILAKFLWHFDVELLEEETGDFLDQRAWAIWWKKPVFVRLREVER